MSALKKMIGAGALALALGATSVPAQSQTFLTIGGGSSGGAFFIISAGMARLIEQHNPELSVTSRATSATIENTRLLGNEQVEFALAADNGPWAAANSAEPFADEHYDNIRYIGAGYTSPFHLVVLDESEIETIDDFAGHRVGILAGMTAQDWFPRIAEVYGVDGEYETFTLRAAELFDSLRDGNIDVAIYSGSAPTASITDLATTHSVRFIPIAPEKAQEVAETHPFFFEYPIEGGIYPGTDEDVPSIGNAILFVTHTGVEDDVVYAVTRTLMENTEELRAIHPNAAAFNLDNVGRAMVVPVHPGAQRYYDEIGLDLTANQ
ncbi:TAXI family TRAP transporter solute-binding subunit [Fodinicurvata sp. EGI_FJ10296]|uniref:TAXI family TRAP transporter solute-binding subunit n=1 Tax=Fodinicurvata sp. EGI_FJ10296 TaxID=3231908 RepID=UPI0034562D2F